MDATLTPGAEEQPFRSLEQARDQIRALKREDQFSPGGATVWLPGGNYVTNSVITDFNRWERTYRPAVGLTGVGNRVAHNLIHDAPHIGIHLRDSNDHVIEFNEIHHVCLETQDTGAIYLGRDYSERGNVFSYNFIHHVGPGEVCGIYLDDCAGGATIFGNILFNTGSGVWLPGGRDTTIENNIFVDCVLAVIITGRGMIWRDMVYGTLKEQLEAVNYQQPPYSKRYPQLAQIAEYYRQGAGIPPEGNSIVRNVRCGFAANVPTAAGFEFIGDSRGRWLWLRDVELSMITVADNWIQGDPGE